jgi:CubicO group peptidase (beta-lactamase class C family)
MILLTPHLRMATNRRPELLVAVVLVVLSLTGSCSATSPPNGVPAEVTTSPATRGAPDASMVTSAVQTYLANILSPAVANLRGVLVTSDGVPVVARYTGTDPATTRDVHSVTKSVLSTLIGIALSEGVLHSVNDTLATLLPQHAGDMNPEVSAITLRQVLTMTAGLPADQPNGDPDPSLSGPDWVASVLRRGTVATPGSAFAYSSAGSHLLAAILTHAVGTSVLEYARPRLFDPLGIDTANAVQPRIDVDPDAQASYDAAPGFAWPKDPTGIELGFAGLKMAPRDMAKLGQLYLDGGLVNGHQVVPAAWVQQATTTQVSTGDIGYPFSESYGYQWWVSTERGHPSFAAVGFGGQLVDVVPDLHLVVVTATDTSNNNIRFELLRSMITDAVIPAIGG